MAEFRDRWQTFLLGAGVLALSFLPAGAVTKTFDLDNQSANGAESKCDLNVLQTYPVKIETVVTNKAVGDAFNFSWPSAGPGGFSSAAAAGTTGGVGVKWTWTTNQSVYAYTGTSCANDVCFLKTAGPDPATATCTEGCSDDGVQLTLARGAAAGETALTWSGGSAAYGVYRSTRADTITAAANRLGQTSNFQYTDVPPAGGVFFYRVRGATCLALKACTSDATCAPSEEGTCVSRGPFAVPGRSLFSNDVTVSSASLTSSLVTFFSPPTELFRITSTAQPGGFTETLVNGGPTPITVTTAAFPAGCCPADPDLPHQLNCDGTCVDYLNDPDNCGACGNVCGEGSCCSNGSCVSLCPEGQIWCDGACRDPQGDDANCGGCGISCGGTTCCVEGTCASYVCAAGRTSCDGECVDLDDDNANCGACGTVCGEGSCCNEGSCVSTCGAGETYCAGLCYETDTDSQNCGTCGNVCGPDSACSDGVCTPCAAGEDVCGNTCVDRRTDPYNCGACGNVCQNSCPLGSSPVCVSGESCGCRAGTSVPPPPALPQPAVPECPNRNPPPGTTDPFCPAPSSTGPVAGACPSPGPPAPEVAEAPVCAVPEISTTILPGESATTCHPGGALFKEVPTALSVCGDGIPGADGACPDGVSKATTGTVMRFVPDEDTEMGAAFLTPFAVHVVSDDSHDGLIQPGETATLLIDVVNAGAAAIGSAAATLLASPVDLTEDGVSNPIAATVLAGSSSYGTIQGTVPTTGCAPVSLHPASNALAFRLAVPAQHPGDTSTPLKLHFTGTVNGSPFAMDVPLALGIADRCVPGASTGDYDGLDGLLSPMGRLVPEGDALPTSLPRLNAGSTSPLKLKMSCGSVSLGAGEVDPPQIVGVSEATRGALDITSLDLNDSANPDDPFFRWGSANGTWLFNMRTDRLGRGVFTLKIRIAGRKDYVTSFEIR